MKDSKNYLGIACFAVLYAVAVFLCAFLGFLHPVCWVGFPILAALVAAFPYYKVASKLQTFGPGLLCALVLALFLLATGELKVAGGIIMLCVGILSDLIRQVLGNTTAKGISLAYPVLALGNISWILPLWTRTEWYHDGAVEEMGADYAEVLMQFASIPAFCAVVILTLVLGFLGIRLAAKWMK